MTTPDLTAMGRDVLAAQPFSRLLGAELVRLTPLGAEIRLSIQDDLRQQHGFVHGGVISYLVDNCLTFAGGAALGGGAVVTSEYKINYLRPAEAGTLIARAEVVKGGATLAVVRCDVWNERDGAEQLCAVAQGAVSRLPARGDAAATA